MIMVLIIYTFVKITGPALPDDCEHIVFGSTLITSPTNKGVILIGGYINRKRSPLLYELSGDSEDNLTWSLLDQKLNTERSHHVSFTIPNNCISTI